MTYIRPHERIMLFLVADGEFALRFLVICGEFLQLLDWSARQDGHGESGV
jgi:hypothetical protein